MQSLSRDLLFGLRALGRSPLFTAIAVLSLALGIGANTAIFSLMDQVLLRSLPVEGPGSLAMVITRGAHYGSNTGPNRLSYPMYLDYRDKNQVFTGMVCSAAMPVSLSYDGAAEVTDAELVSGSYFQVLGVRPALGRVFGRGDETNPGANPIVVLHHGYWKSRFKGDPDILGKTIRLSAFPMTVVGVAAPGYDGLVLGTVPKVFVPITMQKQLTPPWDHLSDRRFRWVQVYGRLKPGVSIQQAEASLRTLHKQIINEEVKDPWFDRLFGDARRDFLRSYAALLHGGQGYSAMRKTMETPLKVLMALVAIVLLIACANVSNLMVARATGRQKEVAVRLALGAGRWRIMRQFLIESLLLATAGGAVGLLVSQWSMRAILLLAPSPQTREALTRGVDLRTLAFTVGISVLAAVLFGLFPALQTSKSDLASAMKEQAGSVAGGHGSRSRQILVVAQVTLSLILLVGSGLFVQSLQNLRNIDPGFRTTNLVRFTIAPQYSGYSNDRARAFQQQLRQRLASLPGAESAALASVGVLSNRWDRTITVEGYRAGDKENMNPYFNVVSPGYLKTMGINLKTGRDFDARDHIKSEKTVLVNETFAKRYFPGRSPLGYHIGFGRGPQVKLDRTIVGIIADAKYGSLREETPRQILISSDQEERPTPMVTYVRTSLPSKQMFHAIRAEIASLDPGIPIYDLITMEDQLDRSLALERMLAFLSSAYGVLASLLAVIGLYGVTAYGVTRRSREIGLRMALGAASWRVVRMILREVLLLTGIGIAIALPAAWWLTQLVRSQLYGIEPHDPLTIGLAALGLLAVAAAAGAAPAFRASRLDPVKVLRYE